MSKSDWGSIDLGGTIGTLQAGGAIRLAHWPGTTDGPGTVILVQGYGEFMEVYGETVGEFRRRGYAVVAFDFRGQGGSVRRVTKATHIGTFRDHVNDLAAVVRFAKDANLPRPFFVAAHSMGGLVALHALPILAPDVARMVLFSPLLEVARLPMPEPLARTAASAASLVGLSRHRVAKSIAGPRDAMNNHLTTDPDRFQAYCALTDANPDLVSGPPSFGWLKESLGAAALMRKRAETPLTIPTLMLASGRDTVVSTPAIDRFARATPGAGLVILPEARHQLFLERDGLRRAAFAAFDAFVASAADGTDEHAVPLRRTSRKPRPARFTATRTGPPVTVEAPRVTPDPPRMDEALTTAPPRTGDTAPAVEARQPLEDDVLIKARRRTRPPATATVTQRHATNVPADDAVTARRATPTRTTGEDDALLKARRRTRVAPPPPPKDRTADPSELAALSALAVQTQPAKGAIEHPEEPKPTSDGSGVTPAEPTARRNVLEPSGETAAMAVRENAAGEPQKRAASPNGPDDPANQPVRAPAPTDESASTQDAVDWASEDSVDALMRTSRRRAPQRKRARRRQSTVLDDQSHANASADWTGGEGAPSGEAAVHPPAAPAPAGTAVRDAFKLKRG